MVRDTIGITISPIPQMGKGDDSKFWSELVVPEKGPGCHTIVLVTRLYLHLNAAVYNYIYPFLKKTLEAYLVMNKSLN